MRDIFDGMMDMLHPVLTVISFGLVAVSVFAAGVELAGYWDRWMRDRREREERERRSR